MNDKTFQGCEHDSWSAFVLTESHANSDWALIGALRRQQILVTSVLSRTPGIQRCSHRWHRSCFCARKETVCFAEHKYVYRAVSRLHKWKLSLRGEPLNASLFIWSYCVRESTTSSAVRRTNTRLHPAGVIAETEDEKDETNWNHCLCSLPLSLLRTLAAGNYSATEHQSPKLICSFRLRADIKVNFTKFGSRKGSQYT